MRRSFNSMVDLLNFCEARKIIPVETYASRLLELGADVAFRASPAGVYDQRNGQCIVDFGQHDAYWRDKDGSAYDVYDEQSFMEARGDIYDQKGNVLISAKSRRQGVFGPERPVFFKAIDVATAIVAEVFQKQHQHVIAMRPVSLSIIDHVYEDLAEESGNFQKAYNSVETMIVDDFSELLLRYEWSDVWLTKARGALVMEVKVDIRIREWYEMKFKEEEHAREQERENGEL